MRDVMRARDAPRFEPARFDPRPVPAFSPLGAASTEVGVCS